MNQQIVASSSSEKYVTLFYGEFDTTCGRLQYSNAGHNYPVLARANGDVELLKDGGPIIGAFPLMQYQASSVQINKDDVLFFFTDGLSEAMNEKEEEYRDERVHKFITDHRQLDPAALIEAILKDVRAFDPTYPPRDDTTIIALKVQDLYEQQRQV